MKKHPFLAALSIAVLLLALVGGARAQGPVAEGRPDLRATLGTAFTYQGRLTDGGSPAEGSYDLRFILYDADGGGAQVGSTVLKENVSVADGYSSVELDCGGVLAGQARYLEVTVRPGSRSPGR